MAKRTAEDSMNDLRALVISGLNDIQERLDTINTNEISDAAERTLQILKKTVAFTQQDVREWNSESRLNISEWERIIR